MNSSSRTLTAVLPPALLTSLVLCVGCTDLPTTTIGVESNPLGADAGAMLPQCSDGIDNDGDGFVDYPADPHCGDLDDNLEGNTPAAACDDGIDNDSNGSIDLDDPSCTSSEDHYELECTDLGGVTTVSTAQLTGTTSTHGDDFDDECAPSTDGGLDTLFALEIPGALSTLHLDTVGSSFDTVLYARFNECFDRSIGCNDDSVGFQSSLELEDVPAGTVYIIVDGFSGGSEGTFTLNVSGELVLGETCDPALVDVLACPMGSTCSAGAASAHICQ